MTRIGKRVVVERDSEDRISGLPRNVIDHILELLPVEDAARTSILSQNWRYIWATLPKLVLDYRFHRNFIGKSQSNFREAVDCILLQHMGDIVKFVLDARGARTLADVVQNGLPSMLNCLWRLLLNVEVGKQGSCYQRQCQSNFEVSGHTILLGTTSRQVQQKNSLISQIYMTQDVGKMGPISCALELIKNSPNLRKLEISVHATSDNAEAILKYMDTPSCLERPVDKLKEVHAHIHNEKSTLGKLLASSRALEVLHLDSFFVEMLRAHIVPNGRPFTLNRLWHLSLGVDFGKMGHISYALQLIKSFPKLSKLDIWVHATSDNAEAILKCLETPSCLEQPLNKLEHVVINYFRSSKAELLFVKLLLSCTPSLLNMCIVQLRDVRVDIALALMHFPGASPRAELFYF